MVKGGIIVYRFVAIDVDDTLIGEDLNVTEANKNSIEKAISQGIKVTLATGRMYRSAFPYAQQLGMDLPLITYHGGLIKTAVSGDTLYHRPVPIDLALQLVRLAKEKDLQLNLYIDDELIVEEENKYTDHYISIAGVSLKTVGDLEEFLLCNPKSEPTKLTIVDSEYLVERLHHELNQFFGSELLITQSRSDFLEITHPHANKGEALEKLTEIYGISMCETVAIGDSLNDLSMVKQAGLGVAMGNARTELKNVADVIVGTNEESGVSQVLDRFVLNDCGREMNGVN